MEMNLALIPEGEAAHNKLNKVYIYIDYIYIYNKIVIKAVEPAKYILKQV